MPQFNSNSNLQPGQIITKETQRGIEFWAKNLQRGKPVCVGTKRGQLYETVKPIFRQRQTINITEAEFAAILESGASLIAVVLPDKSGTYSIEVERFARYSQPYEHPDYGRQLACPLKYFQFSSKVAPRTARRDSPVLEQPGPIAPREKQLTLNGWMK